MARRRSTISRIHQANVMQPKLRKATGYKSVPRRASVSAPSVTNIARKVDRMNREIKKGRVNKSSTHPLHDYTGAIHAMTGARLTDGRPRPHSSITHLRPYRIPKGMHSRKRVN